MDRLSSASNSKRMRFAHFLFAFISGFISVLVFHQGMLALLHAVGLTPRTPFGMQPTQPFGIPLIWSLAFWGGVWGLPFAVGRLFPRGKGYWVTAILFGAIGPTLAAWFLVAPLKGQALAAGWKPAGMATGLLVNAAWGLGTALFLRGMSRFRGW